jgi:hypothetical protein
MSRVLQNARRLLEILRGQHPESTDPRSSNHMDAAATVMVERALVEIKTEIVKTIYGPLKSVELIPLATGTDPGAETVEYKLLSDVGLAKVISNYATDLPIVSVALDAFDSPVFTVACAYLTSWLDLLRIAKAGPNGVNLGIELPRAARQAIARKIDEIGAIGIPEVDLSGFVNHANVPTITLTNGDWLDAARTPDEILADLREWEEGVISQSLEHWYSDTIVLPGPYYVALMQPRATYSDRSIWEVFQMQSQLTAKGAGEWTLERWSYLDDVGGIERGVMYRKDPEVLELEVPLEYDELPPQDRNLSAVTPALGRVGGCFIKSPYGMLYATNINEA